MTALLRTGFEVNTIGTFTLAGEDANLAASGALTTGTLTIDSGTFRSGNRSLKAVVAAQGGIAWKFNFTAVLANTYYARHCVFFPSSAGFPSANALFSFLGESANAVLTGVTSAGVLTVWHQSVATSYITGPALALDTWYVVETAYTPNTGATTLMLNEQVVGTGTGDVAVSTTFLLDMGLGNAGAGNITGTVFIDDVGLNDSTGTVQNSWCGVGKLVLLTPTADSARTGFTAGAGGTTNLFNAVKSEPPIGLSQAGMTNSSQIVSANSNTTDNYQATLQTYIAGGVPAASSIVLVQGLANIGSGTTTSLSLGVQALTNPAVAETTGATGVVAVATWPTGWTTLKTAFSYAPAVVLGTAPTMEVRRNTASAVDAMADFVGLYVEYVEQPVPPRLGSGTYTRNRILPFRYRGRAWRNQLAPVRVTSGTTFAQLVASYAPTTWLRMSDNGSTEHDVQGANNGTYSGGFVQGTVGLLANDRDTAVLFSGSTSGGAVQVPGPAYAGLSSGSIGFLFQWSSGTSLVRDNTGTLGWILGFDNAGTFAYRIGGGATINTSLTTAAMRSGTHFLLVTFNASTAVAYVDGLQVGSGAVGSTAAVMSWRIAQNGNIANQFALATIDEVQFYSYPLSAAQAATLYQAATGTLPASSPPAHRRPASIVAYGYSRLRTIVPLQAAPAAPTYVPLRSQTRARFLGVKGRRGLPVFPSDPVPSFRGVRARIVSLRRGSRTFPVPRQSAPPTIPGNRFPAVRRWLVPHPRGRTVWPQQNQAPPVTPPTVPGNRVAAGRRIAGLVRGHRWTPTPPQTPVPPTIPGNRRPSSRVLQKASRGAQTLVYPVTAAPAVVKRLWAAIFDDDDYGVIG